MINELGLVETPKRQWIRVEAIPHDGDFTNLKFDNWNIYQDDAVRPFDLTAFNIGQIHKAVCKWIKAGQSKITTAAALKKAIKIWDKKYSSFEEAIEKLRAAQEDFYDKNDYPDDWSHPTNLEVTLGLP